MRSVNWAKRFAVKRALRKPTPKRFSLDSENWPNIDYYSVHLTKKENNDLFAAREFNPPDISAIMWDGEKFEETVQIPLSEIQSYDIEITHFFRQVRTKYTDAKDFLWGDLTLKPQRYIFGEWLAQRAYNQNTKFRHDRIAVLRELMALRLSRASDDFPWLFDDHYLEETELFRAIYGDRVFGHEQSDRELAQFHFLLESLVASGELEKSEKKYRVSDNAIKSVAEYEEQERRHQDNVIHNNRLFWITVVLAVAAFAQVLAAVYF